MLILLSLMSAKLRTNIIGNGVGSTRAKRRVVNTSIVMGRSPKGKAIAKLSKDFGLSIGESGCALIYSCINCGGCRIDMTTSGGRVMVPLGDSSITLSRIIIMTSGPKEARTNTENVRHRTVGIIGIVDTGTVRLSPSVAMTGIVRQVSNMAVRHGDDNRKRCTVLHNVSGHCGCALMGKIGVPDPSGGGHFIPLSVFPSRVLSHLRMAGSLATGVRNSKVKKTIGLVVGSTPSRHRFAIGLSANCGTVCFSHSFRSFGRKTVIGGSPCRRVKVPRSDQMAVSGFAASGLQVG